MFKILAVLSVSLCVVFAAPEGKVHGDQEGCYVEGVGLIPLGQWKPSKTGCYDIRCQSVNPSTITSVGCAQIQVLRPCTVVEDLTKLFPECCPRAHCP